MVKYKLDFVNIGKDGKAREFEIPKMTVELHEKAMESIAEKQDKMPEQRYNAYMTKYVIAAVLNKVDKKKTAEQYVDDINKMHPDDMIDLFEKVWSSGRKGSGSKFRLQPR